MVCSRGSLAASKPLSMASAEHRLRFQVLGICGDQLARGRRCRPSAASLVPGARRRLRFDVETLARRHLVAQRHRLAIASRARIWGSSAAPLVEQGHGRFGARLGRRGAAARAHWPDRRSSWKAGR
jgi:hypothetical protein